jgi:4-amino-4-deoxy-L-arabinose transferase-like glycosyltransferase
LLIILVIAAGLRLYRIDVFPPGLYADVAANGLDTFHLSLDHIQILYDRGRGNSIEGLIVWLEWPVMELVGRGPIFVYLTTVLIGLVTLPVHFLLARRLMGSTRIALISAALLAFSFWDVHFSRLGYRTLLLPLALDAVFLSGLWAVQRGGRWRYLAAGLLLGIGNYTYTSYRLILVVLGGLGLLRVRRKRALPGTTGERVAYIAGAVVTSAPLVAAAVMNPSRVFSRAEGVALWGSPLAQVPGQVWDHLIKTLGMFNVWGDPERQYDLPHLPLFDPLVGIAFVIGIAVAWRRRRDDRYAFLLLCLVVFTMVVFLSDRTPHFLRASGLIPAAYLLAAVGVEAVIARLRRGLATALAVAVAVISVLWTALFYFAVYPTTTGLYTEFSGYFIDVGRFMNGSDFGGRPLYVVYTFNGGSRPSPDSFRAQTLQFATQGRVNWTFLPFSDIAGLSANRVAVVYDAHDPNTYRLLRTRYPSGAVVDTIALSDNGQFAVFYGDGPGVFRAAPVGAYTNLSS